ncbi:hypothetical protein BOTBODRAFT_170054 [Botryobasidium botryosum FD-172 SS1]|uniref:Uncharacterized protein n=1 Tax=Botryobasidium botryosum (strain FD-172 SS1) TaxID=930990 RepID=A0A067N7B1_BOTB1|nr:hypothetical protein BOTBODRAFT_170054 [Botryobasidium botryosum FD-172 SS1]
MSSATATASASTSPYFRPHSRRRRTARFSCIMPPIVSASRPATQPPSRPFTPPSVFALDHEMHTDSGSSSSSSSQSTVSSPRPSLPTSLASFALSHPTSSSAPTSPLSALMTLDEPHTITGSTPSVLTSPYPLIRKLRRPSLLGLGGITKSASSTHLSLLSSSSDIMIPTALSWKERERARTRRNSSSASSSSGKMKEDDSPQTPPLFMDDIKSRPTTPATPPPRSASLPTNPDPESKPIRRRPPKPQRLLTLMSEFNTPDAEFDVKSDASFQRLLASHPELPIRPRAPRPLSERGRFPEEVRDDEPIDDGNSSASEDEDDMFGDETLTLSGASVDNPSRGSSSSPNGMDLDIGILGQSPMSLGSTSNAWRETPPPSTVRMGKRKFNEDRYEPYPSTKRRAVSPSVSTLVSPIFIPRSSPINIPRPLSTASSPILRPIPRLASAYGYGHRGDSSREEREVNGAGDGVGSLNLG